MTQTDTAAAAFIVCLPSGYNLRGTIWTDEPGRAQRFPTREAAEAAFERAKKFMRPSQRKLARIVAAPTTTEG